MKLALTVFYPLVPVIIINLLNRVYNKILLTNGLILYTCILLLYSSYLVILTVKNLCLFIKIIETIMAKAIFMISVVASSIEEEIN